MHTARLVGRDRELAILRQAIASARRKRGGALLVAGDTGMGKTALVERAVDQRDLIVLRGAVVRSSRGPLGPLLQALRSHPAWATIADAALRLPGGGIESDALGALLEVEPTPGTSPAADGNAILPSTAVDGAASVISAIGGLVSELARHGPLVIVLDDLQAADVATLDAIEALAATGLHDAYLLIGMLRTDELPRGSPVRRMRVELRRAGRLNEIVLAPLDAAATVTLAGAVLGARPGPELAARLVDRSQGLPLFVEELAAALVADRAVSIADGVATLVRDDLPIPETLRDSIMVRFDGLAKADVEALSTAALIGDPIDVSLVELLVPDSGRWLRTGQERGVLITGADGTLTFRHGLVREVLVDELPAPERRTLHRRIAAALATRGAAPLLVADHWLQGGDPDAAVPCLLEAADAFARVHAYRDAANAFRRALDEDHGAIRSRVVVLERLAASEELAGASREAARVWAAVATDWATQGNAERAASAFARRARALELHGRWAQSVDARLAAADAYAEAGLPGAAATERLAAAAHLRSAARFTAAIEVLDVAHAEAVAAGRPDLIARATGLAGNVLARSGRADEGLLLVREGLALALDGGLATPAAELYQRLADSLEHAGRYDPARAAYLEGAAYCRTQSLEPTAQLCLACMAVVLWQTGRWRDSEQTSRAVLASPASTPHARAVAHGMLGLVSTLRGSTSRSRPHLEASLRLARHIELAAMELISTWGLAMADWADGDVASATDRCGQIIDRWTRTEERHYVVPALRWAATAFEDLHDSRGTQTCAEALAGIAAQTPLPETIAAFGAALGAAASVGGDPVGAADHLASALATISGCDLPLERAEIGRRAGVAMIHAGRREEGAAALVSAARTARRLGATPLGARIASDLTALGESVEGRLGSREARRLASRGLTARELEVLHLVARGMTSRDIGRALFLSPRTIEMHVENALLKLDCRTRAEAVQSLASLGLLATASPAGGSASSREGG